MKTANNGVCSEGRILKRFIGIALGAVLACILCSIAPTFAFAVEGVSVDGNITITLATQGASASALAKTGDALVWLAFGLFAMVIGAVALVLASRKASVSAGQSTSSVSMFASNNKGAVSVAIASALIALLCFGQFATNTAYAVQAPSGVTCSSQVVVNEEGQVISNSLSISNASDDPVFVDNIQAFDSLSDWSAQAPSQVILAGADYADAWYAEGVSADIVQQLKSNGGTITLPMQITVSTAYAVNFEMNGMGEDVEEQYVKENGTATQPTVAPTSDYQCAGWYTDSALTQAYDFNTPVTSDLTLYAKWAPRGYWLAPAAVDDPTAEVTAVMSSVDADIEAIKNGDAETIAKYNSYLEDDSVHLYTRWNGSTVDTEGAQEANGYVEFRILQVGDHDGEGCALTFQATHLLTNCYVMNDETEEGRPWYDKEGKEHLSYSTNTGGWAESKLRAELQEGGEIYSNFDTDFTDKILTVSKKSSKGDQSTELTSSDNKFWIPCFSELTGVSIKDFVCDEGTQYEFYKLQGVTYIDGKKNFFDCLKLNTRAGNKPLDLEAEHALHWWQRSPALLGNSWMGSFIETLSPKGCPDRATVSESHLGVTPAFCF